MAKGEGVLRPFRAAISAIPRTCVDLGTRQGSRRDVRRDRAGPAGDPVDRETLRTRRQQPVRRGRLRQR
ncbi:MAG: hypothetical protein MZV70_72900 [Desulfobacterales bacterium]|nr:hypothetical protein [Desulfobacterales bacterium]